MNTKGKVTIRPIEAIKLGKAGKAHYLKYRQKRIEEDIQYFVEMLNSFGRPMRYWFRKTPVSYDEAAKYREQFIQKDYFKGYKHAICDVSYCEEIEFCNNLTRCDKEIEISLKTYIHLKDIAGPNIYD